MFGRKEIFAVEFQQDEKMAPRLFGGVRIWIENLYIGGLELKCTGFLGTAALELMHMLSSNKAVTLSSSLFIGLTKEEIHDYFFDRLCADDTSAEFYKYLFSIGEIDDDFTTFFYFDVETDSFCFFWKYRGGGDEFYKDHIGEVFKAMVSFEEVSNVVNMVNRFRKEVGS